MLEKCSQEITVTKENEETLAAQKKSFHEVTHELVRQITSPNTIVREQVYIIRYKGVIHGIS
jgi:transformation/transcription domain-associated protein